MPIPPVTVRVANAGRAVNQMATVDEAVASHRWEKSLSKKGD
jgi:hypothetical protein